MNVFEDTLESTGRHFSAERSDSKWLAGIAAQQMNGQRMCQRFGSKRVVGRLRLYCVKERTPDGHEKAIDRSDVGYKLDVGGVAVCRFMRDLPKERGCQEQIQHRASCVELPFSWHATRDDKQHAWLDVCLKAQVNAPADEASTVDVQDELDFVKCGRAQGLDHGR